MSVIGRRDLLRMGAVQLGGVGLFGAAGGASAARPQARARACILLFMDGGPSHIDLFDLKPDAPAEIRGPFGSIPTTIPGIRVSEHLPLVARQMHRITQVRSVCHAEMVHDPAVYQTLTGRRHLNTGGDLKVDAADFPQMGTAFAKVDRSGAVMPPVIELPETMRMGARILPGQNAGFLGSAYEPFRVEVTPEAQVVRPELARRPEVDGGRLARRSSLLSRLNGRVAELQATERMGELGAFQRQALSILADPKVHQAFDLDAEPDAVRDRYGRSRHGQSVLLARRLVEAGSRFVTVYWGKEPQDWADGRGPRIANNPWDTHRNHFPLTRDELAPRADRALATLLQDLSDRGALEETLVVWMGEFGRSPKISEFASREHWPFANTILLAGAGLPGGAVYGRTDAWAAEVVEDPVCPADVTATIFHLLGIDPHALIHDQAGRPYPLSEGEPIRGVLG
ncbi:MAG: DUF1501 domain-containing protein [Actinomycetota bacterium]